MQYYPDKKYDIPVIYSIIHILVGIITVWYPYIGIIFIIYQLIQYILNIRIFMFSYEVKKGNNIYHTLYKLYEMMLGIIAGAIILYAFD